MRTSTTGPSNEVLRCGATFWIKLIVGLFTRIAAFVASGEMAVAYWLAHAPQNFFPVNNGGDAAILYCFVFLLLVFTGPGKWSIDGMRGSEEA